MENKQKWTGVWLPKEWYLYKGFSWTEKLLLTELYYLEDEEGCFATNKHFADHLNITKGHVANLIGKLKEGEHIVFLSSPEERRSITVSENIRKYLEPTPENPSGKSDQKNMNTLHENMNTLHENMNTLHENMNDRSEKHEPPLHENMNYKYKNKKEMKTEKENIVTTPTQSQFDEDSMEYILAKFLMSSICSNFPIHEKQWPIGSSQREKTLQSWAKIFSLMKKRDNLSDEEILNVLEWCQLDSFWRVNILSAGKFRKKYFDLAAKMETQSSTRKLSKREEVSNPNPEVTDEIIVAYRKLINNDNYVPSDRDLPKFYEATRRMEKFYAKSDKTHPFSIGERAKHLYRVLNTQYVEAGKMVEVGMLCSDRTWEQLMPAYLSRTFGL